MSANLNPTCNAIATLNRLLVSGTIACASTFTASAVEPARESPAQLVGALHSAFGEHHARAVHAKGVILEGKFTPTSEARKLSSAMLFTKSSVPVIIRFSSFTGIPDIPDTIEDANPRGFAVKFNLPDGAGLDIVTHSFNGFPTATADEFAQLLRAIGASGPKATKPTALDQFLGSHPIAKTFLTTQKPAPVSFATLPYFGVNSFKFIDSTNKSSYVRYRFVPKAREQYLDASALKSRDPNYLADEIATRVAKAPIVYEWYAQISATGDVIDDPSVAWPENRKLVKLGTLTIERMTFDAKATDKTTLFLPGSVPTGIEAADPMIALRNAAYPISFGERQ